MSKKDKIKNIDMDDLKALPMSWTDAITSFPS